jgi:hypothetical protein
VSGFARKAMNSASDRAPDRDSPADARTQGHEDGVINSLRDAIGHLGNERTSGVVLYVHRDTKRALNRRSNRNIDHALKIWRSTQNLSIFDQPRETNPKMAFGATHLGEFKK